MKHPLRRWLLCLLPGIVGLPLLWWLPHAPQVAEWVFARGIFRVLSVLVGSLVALLPFSLTELAAVLALPALLLLLVLFVRRLRRTASRRAAVGRAVRGVCWVVSSAFCLYMLLHGANFYRLSAAELLDIDPAVQSPETLLAVCVELAEHASAERALVSEDADGCMVLTDGVQAALRQADDGYRALDDDYPVLWGGVWRAKPVLLSHWWSYTGIAGMYFPLLAEANVNTDMPDSEIPATAAHELAHTRGFAREDECNFFAYLACIQNDSADIRYSGYLLAYVYCSNALYDYSPAMWEEAAAHLSDGVRRDLAQRSAYWRSFEGEVQQASTSVNNAFIQAQGDEDGVLSYDRVVGLIVGYHEKTCNSH